MATNLIVGAASRPASDDRRFVVRHPVTREPAGEAAAASGADARLAVDAAAAAFPIYRELPPAARRSLLSRAAELLIERSDEFAAVMAAELGATPFWSQANVHAAAAHFREAAAIVTQIAGETLPTDRVGSISLTFRQPAGVVLGIAPWNAPVILGVRAIATPLACGNTVVLKGSEACPRTHCMIVDVLRDAGFADGVVNYVCNAPEDAGPVVEALIAHPAVRRVNFTGSTRVGRIIGELSGRHLKPAVLELGGKAPMVVLADADLDLAAAAAAFGAFANAGQICMSTERVVVVEEAADRLVAGLADRAVALDQADAAANHQLLGALVTAGAVARAQGLIADAVAKGAVVVAGGHVANGRLAPTVVDKVTAGMRLYGEESFAPITAVIRVADADAAVTAANDSAYGLSAAVFGRDLSATLRVARRIDSGICHINAPTIADDPQAPFGGVKDSGFGRFGGQAGIEAFTELRWVTIATQPVPLPF